MPNKRIIGKVIIDLDTSGTPTKAIFVPASFTGEYNLGAPKLPVKDEAQAAEYALGIMAAYFVHMDKIEMHDPELSRMKHEVLVCEKHINSLPKHCEIEFYLEDLVNQ